MKKWNILHQFSRVIIQAKIFEIWGSKSKSARRRAVLVNVGVITVAVILRLQKQLPPSNPKAHRL